MPSRANVIATTGIVRSAQGAALPTQPFAFAIDTGDVAAWETRLSELGIAIESRVTWERGGLSLYFRDPDNHLVELATPGIWPIY